jgi:hypothetical protein
VPGDGPLRDAAAAACLLLLTVTAAVAADASTAVEAVTTPGSGTLTKCRDWLVYDSCSLYHRIALPERVAVGDRFKLKYGSNPKIFMFDVVGIRRDGDHCTILSGASRDGERGEKIEVAPCGPAVELRTEPR